jgi:dihydrofolate synthase / folylpolyglutamate synthase
MTDEYAGALRRLYRLDPGRMLPGRERLGRLLELAGHPELAAPSVLVGGTNGKGRYVAALSAILARRYRVGAFIKPHLVSIRERWRIMDQPVSQERFTAAAQQACDLIEQHGIPISFFEANVLLGALLFREAGCEIAVWEVGLGGRHDACNLTMPCLSVLTGVGYDHQAVLGQTLAEIARDKAHIARSGHPLLLAPPRPGWSSAYAEYAPVVQAVCAELGAICEPALEPEAAEWRAHERQPWSIPPDTLALIAASLPHLAEAGFPLTPDDVQDGLGALTYRARMELVEFQGLPVLLDAAHNVDALRWLAQALGAGYLHSPRVRRGTATARGSARHPIAFACQATRDPLELLAELAPVAASITPLEIPVLHPCPAGRIAAAARELGLPVALPPGYQLAQAPQDYAIGHVTELDPPDNSTHWIECLEYALGLSTDRYPTVVCGSIYALGEILRAFEVQRGAHAG